MNFTYNDGDLTTELNKVRRLIGDTSSTAAEYSDEEINFFIGEEANIYGAVAMAARGLAFKYAQKVTKSVGPLSIQLSQKYDHYKELSDKFASLAVSKGSPSLYAGGISVSDKETYESDSDRVSPYFYRGMDDFPGTTLSSTNS